MRDINLIVIHCADTPNDMDIGAKEINEWHLERGFKGIGYHYVIRRNGTIENGRPVEEMGAHVRRHNWESIGICLVGKDQYTDPQWSSLEHLIRDLLDTYPNAKIKGHGELDRRKSYCPGFDVQNWVSINLNLSDQYLDQ